MAEKPPPLPKISMLIYLNIAESTNMEKMRDRGFIGIFCRREMWEVKINFGSLSIWANYISPMYQYQLEMTLPSPHILFLILIL